MNSTTIRLVTLALLLVTAGCSNNRQTNNPDNEQWFCQTNVSGDGWECVQDEQLAQVPVPTRMPSVPEAEEEDLDPLGWDELEAPLQRGPQPPGSGQAPSDAGNAQQVVTVDAVTMTTEDEVTDTSAGVEITTETSANEVVTVTQIDSADFSTDAAVSAAGADPISVNPSVPKHVRLAYVPPKPTPIMDLNPDFFAVQLLAMDTVEEMEAFVTSNNLVGMSAAEVEKDGQVFYVLILGIYETFAIAQEASTDLPPPLETVDVWIRPLGDLQQAMDRAYTQLNPAEPD